MEIRPLHSMHRKKERMAKQYHQINNNNATTHKPEKAMGEKDRIKTAFGGIICSVSIHGL